LKEREQQSTSIENKSNTPLTFNSLIHALSHIENRITSYKELVRIFYFNVLFSLYLCPECGKRLRSVGPSQASCECGTKLDPTLTFQRSSCCNATVLKKVFHYACSQCDKTIRSMFLFDERIFDATYFCEMMEKSRERKRKKQEAIRKFLAETRSDALELDFAPAAEVVGELNAALDEFVHAFTPGLNLQLQNRIIFHMEEYSEAIRKIIQTGAIWFSALQPICTDLRKDRAWRFVTLIYMQQDREVELEQHGNDLLVRRYEAYGEG